MKTQQPSPSLRDACQLSCRGPSGPRKRSGEVGGFGDCQVVCLDFFVGFCGFWSGLGGLFVFSVFVSSLYVIVR